MGPISGIQCAIPMKISLGAENGKKLADLNTSRRISILKSSKPSPAEG